MLIVTYKPFMLSAIMLNAIMLSVVAPSLPSESNILLSAFNFSSVESNVTFFNLKKGSFAFKFNFILFYETGHA
jgi:hypothetical protein